MTRVFSSLDDVRATIGEELGPGTPITVEQSRIDAFADATGDHQWIHVDPERAAAGPYGATIAHGYLTLSLLPQFGADLFTIDFGGARINYGANKVRFPAPVLVNSVLTATATVVDVADGPAGAMITIKYVVTAEGAAKPALVAETLVVVTP
ncbi:MaoC family dehydratase [Gordonia alkaliphila]|uniref:MaoC family dehydratase n=1 Tax=Gordonia alkaliphila TaxID=1053547 RepID=UPI001FF2D344|nr:MaoC family dehydratase [Gordonia alkaliphila]MCK0438934.1 MaoC family dehydratase [Gordonia alkaliphila]